MAETEKKRIPWRRVEPLDPAKLSQNGALAALNALRDEWENHLQSLQEAERVLIRQRSLRKLSIETGIIERLYDIDWGLTLTLVAEGFSKEVIERAGGNIDESTIETLKAQRDSLEMVIDFVRAERPLGSAFIKELHSALTRTQDTHVVYDMHGRRMEIPLEHGIWKKQPNHVERQDGTVLEYTPPEHVASEIDRFIELFLEMDSKPTIHPIIKAAWLHHAFVCIHPFADGNGRVARALTLLVLERHHFAPLVVDRFHRDDYLKALDSANSGDLGRLVSLFVRLESNALAGELERPPESAPTGLSSEVAHTLADQLAALRSRHLTQRQKALNTRATAVQTKIEHWFDQKTADLREIFKQKKIPGVHIVSGHAGPGDDKVYWFRGDAIASARVAGHFADFTLFPSWASIRIRVEGVQLRYIASLHGAGRDSGVMAITTFAILEDYHSHGTTVQTGPRTFIESTKDSFRFVHTENMDSIVVDREKELSELLDGGLTVALAYLLKRI